MRARAWRERVRKTILLRIIRPNSTVYCKFCGGFSLEKTVFSVLCDLSLSTTVVFSGAYNHVCRDVAEAMRLAHRFHLDKYYRLTRFYTFWGGYFAALRLEPRSRESDRRAKRSDT